MKVEMKDLSNWKELAVGHVIYHETPERNWWEWDGGEDVIVTQALWEDTPDEMKEGENILLFPPHRVRLLFYDPVIGIYHGKHIDHSETPDPAI